jgi:P4 family phage/plasmid primase-like protien
MGDRFALSLMDLANEYAEFENFFDGVERRLVHWQKTFFVYNEDLGCFQAHEDDAMENRINRWLANAHREICGTRKTEGMMRVLRSRGELPSDFKWNSIVLDDGTYVHRPHLQVVRNGVFDVERWIALNGRLSDEPPLRSKSPRFLSLTSLPFDYDPEATAPIYERVVAEIYGGDEKAISAWNEWVGYHFNCFSNFSKFMIIHGPGGNGKSVLMKILQAVLGRGNYSNIPIDEFYAKSSALWLSMGKLGNIYGEMGDIDRLCEQTLKAYIGGDVIASNPKFKPHVYFTPTAKLTFCTNNLPHFSDKTEGIWRRIMVLSLKQKFEGENRNPAYLRDGHWDGQLSGIFNIALQGLYRAVLRNGLAETDEMLHGKHEYRMSANPVIPFIESCLEADPFEVVSVQALNQAFQDWASRQGYRPGNLETFGKALRNALTLLSWDWDEKRQISDGAKLRCIRGLKFKMSLVN